MIKMEFLKKFSEMRKIWLIVFTLLLDISFYFIAYSKYEVLRSFVSPFFMFLFPGIGVVLLIQKNTRTLELFIESFSVGTLLNLILTASTFSKIGRNQYLLIIFSWTIFSLITSLMKAIIYKEKISFGLNEALVLLLSFGLYVTLFTIFKSLHYFPTPDEANYLHNARFSPILDIYTVQQWHKPYILAVIGLRSFWHATLHSFLLFSQASAISAQAVGAFFMAFMPIATYLIGSHLFSNKNVGLISAALTAMNPVLFMFSITMLVDVAFAFYVVSALYFYIGSLKFESFYLIRIDYAKFLVFLYLLALAYMIKWSIVPATVFFIHFLIIVYKSKLKERKKLLLMMIGLLLAYIFLLDIPFFIAYYFLHNYQLAQKFVYFVPYSFCEDICRFILHPSSDAGLFYNVSAIYVLKGFYLTVLSPFYMTMPVLALFLAGVMLVISGRSFNDYERHFSRLMLVLLLFDTFAILLFRPICEFTRQGLYKWPLIMIFAAYGVVGNVKKWFEKYLVSFILVVLVVIFAEYILINNDWGIVIAVIGPSPSERVKIGTMFFSILAGFFIVLWKGGVFYHTFSLKIRFGSRISNIISVKIASLVVSLIILVACVAQIHFYAVNGEFRTKGKEFPITASWLEAHVHDGDLVVCNAKRFLEVYLSDSTLKKINYTSFPETENEFIHSLPRVKYLIMFSTAYAYWEPGYDYSENGVIKWLSSHFFGNITHAWSFQEAFKYPETEPDAIIYKISLTEISEHNPTVIAEDDQTSFWTPLVTGMGNITKPVISDDVGTKIKGGNTLKIVVGNGTDGGYWHLIHNYASSQDWSNKDFYSIYWYGGNTGYKLRVLAQTSPGFLFFDEFTDSFSGWMRIIFPFNSFFKVGDPTWSSITTVEVYSQTDNATGTWYLDRVVIDVW